MSTCNEGDNDNAARWTLSHYEKNQTKCDELLAQLSDWSSIPTINRESLDAMKDGSVVRYVGMIQDILNPEYYYATYNVKDTITGAITVKQGIYRDLLHCFGSEELHEDGSESTNQAARHPIFCIPVPGLNEWAVPVSPMTQAVDLVETSRSKRAFEADGEPMDVADDKNIRRKSETNSHQPHATSASRGDAFDKYFPLGERAGLACIVKHYGEHEDWLINTKIEVLGFLSVSPELEVSGRESDAEDRAMHPPPSLVPRIHALHIRKLHSAFPIRVSADSCQLGMERSVVRSDLITTLTQLLYGDVLAAEYLLCQLLSTVYARSEGIAIGALSLNLCNIPHVPQYPQLLFTFLQTLLPFSSYLPLSIDLLNNSSFIPRKDYESNRLWSGRLQLADGTHLLIDETNMTEGNLLEPGVRNMAALHSLCLRQSLPYDFTYFQLDFDTNIPVVVLSQGKSIIPTNIVLKVLPEDGTASTMAETFQAAQFFLAGPRLEAARKYLSMLRLCEFNMDSTDFVGAAWAELRQKDHRLGRDDLHNLLVLARLVAISDGSSSLSQAHWDRAVAMEASRRRRV